MLRKLWEYRLDIITTWQSLLYKKLKISEVNGDPEPKVACGDLF
jgi:hypothetical protein